MPGRIEELIKGKKYRITVEAGKKPSNKTGRKRLRRIFYGNKTEAGLFKASLETDIARGTYIDPSKLTFREYLLRWYDNYVKANLAPTTQRRYRDIINLRIIPILGDIPLEKLRTTHIKDFYAQIIKDGQIVKPKQKKEGDKEEKPVRKPLSKASLEYHHRVIHKSLNDAIEDELIQHNPAPIKPPRPPQDPDDAGDDIHEKVQVLTPDQVDTLLLRLDPQGWHYALCFVAVWTGLRRGELLGIRWQDINFAAEQLSVRQAIAYTPEMGVFIKKKLKNKNSRRTIDINPEVIDVLKALRKKQVKVRLLYDKNYEDNDLVFCQPNGKPIHPDTPSNWFPEFLEKIKVHKKCNEFMMKPDYCHHCDKKVDEDDIVRLPRLNFHCLRHTHASLMLLAGNSIEYISKRLGHSSIRVTYDIYTHLIPSAEKTAVGKFAALFKK